MTLRKPLVLVSGVISELTATDTLATIAEYPSLYPSLYINFAGSQLVDSRVTFTRATPATRTNLKGLIEAVLSGVPRIDYAPVTLECKGLLVEEARTNYVPYSQTVANWTLAGITNTGTTVVAPDGTNAAVLLASTVAETHRVTRATSSGLAGTTVHAYGAYVHIPAGSDVIRLTLRIRNGVNGQLVVVSAAGTGDSSIFTFVSSTPFGTYAPAAVTAASFTATPVGGGWHRLVVVSAAATDATVVSQIDISASTSPSSEVGVGTTNTKIAYWGLFAEAGTFSTSYIPTPSSTAVIRNADVVVMTGTNFSSWYRQDEFSAVCKFIGNAVGTHTVASWNDATANEVIKLESVSGALTLTITDGGVTQVAVSLGSVVTGTSYTVAAAWKLNDIAASVNGAIVVTDTAATLPTPTQLTIGSLAYILGYPTRLTNVQLQALSTQ